MSPFAESLAFTVLTHRQVTSLRLLPLNLPYLDASDDDVSDPDGEVSRVVISSCLEQLRRTGTGGPVFVYGTIATTGIG
jgi:hypothetical protein